MQSSLDLICKPVYAFYWVLSRLQVFLHMQGFSKSKWDTLMVGISSSDLETTPGVTVHNGQQSDINDAVNAFSKPSG